MILKEYNEIFTEYFIKPFANLRKLADENNCNSRLIFRGISNFEHDIVSGAARRLKFHQIQDKRKYAQIDFISYHVNLIEQKKNINVNKDESLTDIEHLSEIQHYGGATCLIDFTYNYLSALFFACTENNKSDGAIFIIDLNNPLNGKISLLSTTCEQLSIDEILRKTYKYNKELQPRIWIWKPTKLNNRVIKQDSVFIFSLSKIERDQNVFYDKIKINNNHKETIILILKTLFNVSEDSIYLDVPGYSGIYNNNNKQIDYSLLKQGTCFTYGRDLYREEKYVAANHYLDNGIACVKAKEHNGSWCKNNCDDKILSDLYFFKALSSIKLEDNMIALNYLIKAKAGTDPSDDDRIYDINTEIIKLLYVCKKYNTAIDFVKNILDEEKLHENPVYGFCVIELAIFTSDFNLYIESLKNMRCLVCENNRSDINTIILYNLYIKIGFVIFSTRYKSDITVEMIKAAFDNNEQSRGMFYKIQHSVFTKHDFDVEQHDLSQFYLLAPEGKEQYNKKLHWELKSLEVFINKKRVDDRVKHILARKVVDVECKLGLLYEKHRLGRDDFALDELTIHNDAVNN